ncbi:hypothetical protein C2R61_01540 [Helicobacter pylori]|nr:hypothetical protein C2R61_01540 [Helicobacter pylori]
MLFYLISLLTHCFVCLGFGFNVVGLLLGFRGFMVLLFYSLRKRKGEGYKPYKRGQKIKIANHINIDQN